MPRDAAVGPQEPEPGWAPFRRTGLLRMLAGVTCLAPVLVGCSVSAPAAAPTPMPTVVPTLAPTPNLAATAQVLVQAARERAALIPTPDTGTLLARLDVLWAGGQWAEVLALLDELERLAPTALDFTEKRYVAHYEAGQELVKQGNPVAAVTQFAKADALAPNRGEAKAALAELSERGSFAVIAPSRLLAPEGGAAVVANGPSLDGAFALLRAYDRQNGTVLAAAAERARAMFRPLPPGVYGAYYPIPNRIVLSTALMEDSVETVASVLAHEAQHAVDVARYGIPRTDVACHNYELTAFKIEAGVWITAHGSAGKEAPATELEEELNLMLHLVRTNPTRLLAELTHRYEDQCG